ncbi:MAG: DUF6678 family protein [Chloroflexia bacterium]
MDIKKPNKLNMRLQRQQQEWLEKRQKKVEQVIAAFSHAHMSNTKWRKAFLILSAHTLGLTRCHWKFVADERVFTTSFPREADLLEEHLADGVFQPEFVYREIEWIEIPAQYQIEDNRLMSRPPNTTYQNVTGALEALNRIGHFPVELTETGLIIRGYS